MSATSSAPRYRYLTALVPLLFAGSLRAEDVEPTAPQWHIDLWYTASAWPALEDLMPVMGGSFRSPAVGIGSSFHVNRGTFGGGSLLFGVEGMLQFGDSNVPVVSSGLFAFRSELEILHGYVAASAKWQFGKHRAISLDAGLGAHLASISVADRIVGNDLEVWHRSAIGPYIGASWDAGRHDGPHTFGLFLSLRAHFVDFGQVADETPPSITGLGSDAGRLDGPVYQLLIGVSSR